MLQGQAALINQLRKGPEPPVLKAYERYQQYLEFIAQLRLVPYDEAASQLFSQVDPAHQRLLRNDARIAACAASRGLIVVTCNLADFEKIGLGTYVDWTRG